MALHARTARPPRIATSIQSARTALAACDWSGAAAAARRALEEDETAEAHELLGLASWWLSDVDALFQARERAYRLFVDAGEVRRAARIAAWLDWDCRAFRGEPVVANGWLRRARRLLEGHHDCAEYGWLLLREADAQLSSDAPAASAGAAAAAALGRRHRDSDLEYVALSLEGLARVAAGNVAEGMQQLDEATAAVVAGEFDDRSAAGVACCHLIDACVLVRDIDRAGQWCFRVREYCRQWNLPPLFAVCRTQYASVLISIGNWAAAEAEIAAGLEVLRAMRPGWIALGYMQLGELRRRQGRLDEAKELFERFPGAPVAWLGLAAIALERGTVAEAEQLARRFLRQVPHGNHTHRAAALELIVLAVAAAGKPDAAAGALDELSLLALQVESAALRGSARLGSAGVAIARGARDDARNALEEAASLFDKAAAPYDGLRVRLLLAELLHSGGDIGAAKAEATAVATRARALGAHSLAERAAALTRSLRMSPGGPTLLTSRERQVLTQVARGLTNRQIAVRLGVSQHTVHRHVANIFNKLGLSARAAAVAFAVRNGLG